MIWWAILAGLIAFWLFGPREPTAAVPFDPSSIGEDVDAYLATEEAKFTDIIPGVEKRVIWADAPGKRTKQVVLYVHGFTATSEEIRPVPDVIAQTLKANLVYTRLTGHGRAPAAMADATAGDWQRDMAEALEVARRVGDEIIVISLSTGATLAAMAAVDDDQARGVLGMALISANFDLGPPGSFVLTWPGIRWWGPMVAGSHKTLPIKNDDHAKYWHTRFPVTAGFVVAALARASRQLDYSKTKIPAIFLYSEEDKVVSVPAIKRVAKKWGGDVLLHSLQAGPGDDTVWHHMIAGDITSPGLTEPVIEAIEEWIVDLQTYANNA